MNFAAHKRVQTSVDPEELHIRLRNFACMAGDPRDVAGLFASMHGSRRWGRDDTPTWAAFVVAEGLRVEDLDSRPSKDVVRALGCALVGVGLTERDAAVVVGVPRPTVNRWVNEAGLQRPARARKRSRAEVGAEAVALVRAEAVAAPMGAEPGLFLAIEQFRVVSRSLAKCEPAFLQGPVEGPHVEGRLRQLHQEMSLALGLVEGCAEAQGVRL